MPLREFKPCGRVRRLLAIVPIMVAATVALADEFSAELPPGVRAVWNLATAERESTPTRERVCINGLWRWQPGDQESTTVPEGHWGYFKVPGPWPGSSDYLQKDSQTVFPHPAWKTESYRNLNAAWYEREISIPPEWTGRRIVLESEYVNSYATVFVDGVRTGEIRFPGGELDLSSVCRAGANHRLSLLVLALPLNGVMLSYSDTASARQVKGTVPRQGLCGDVFLVGTPAGPRIGNVRVETSVRNGRVSIAAELLSLPTGIKYRLRARVTQDSSPVTEFTSPRFSAADLKNGRYTLSEEWRPDRLWDLHSPGNTFSLSLSLLDSEGHLVDTAWTAQCGFREFWIDGRDFYLNGTRIFLSAVPLDNAQIGAGLAGYEAARESLERLRNLGINMVYTHNYGCEPGSHLSFAEILRAADGVGMLVSFSQPHFAHYDWKRPDPESTNAYRRHAEFYVRQAQNHPSVVLYSMSHNATGYSEDMNPDLIDGIHNPRDRWAENNAKLALRAEAIVRSLDPSRIVYHHSSGNLGSMHTMNFYPNFAPIQELSDWFEHWAKEGVKPLFTCEYGAPFTWDWSMYRGWYKGERSFGSARVPWEFCFAEWNAQFLGDRAYRITEMEKANLRWEAKQFRGGNLWHRWDYPYEIGSRLFDDRHDIIGRYLTDNLRAFRTWGVSATSPWEFAHFFKPREGLDRSRKNLPVDWDKLQRPGFSPDYIENAYERIDVAHERSDWVPTADGEALLRNNRPLLAYIGGPPVHFTSKEHTFRPGETVEKQLILINNTRETVSCDCAWSLNLPDPVRGQKQLSVKTGQIEKVPFRVKLPSTLAAGSFELTATFTFSTGETQRDALIIQVLPRLQAHVQTDAKIALFDPKGETAALLKAHGLSYQTVGPGSDLSAIDVLIVGKAALTVDGPAPRLGRVRDGLKVIVFEQTTEPLAHRLGFRVTEYGLRQVFPRLLDHPLLAGLDVEHFRDWRGNATILPSRLTYEMRPRYGPTVQWCDLPVTRVWRCGNRGNVASVLIEKPARGDFLPVVDGGFSLQFSPLLEYREGRGVILFCQLDVTGRTEHEPATDRLVRNIFEYILSWKPPPRRHAVYAGEPAGLKHLEATGISASRYDGGRLTPDQVLVVGPGGGQMLEPRSSAIADWLEAGGNLLAIGLDAHEANAFLPRKVETKTAEHIATYFDPFEPASLLAGVGPADVHNRDPRDLPLLTAGARTIGDGVLARSESGHVVFCQLVPWHFDDFAQKPNIKRTYRQAARVVSRLLANTGVASASPILERFATPAAAANSDRRWTHGLYLDQPEEMDDPYRFFRW